MVSNYWQFSFCRFLGSVFMNSKLCAAGSLRIHSSFIFHSVRFYLDGHKLDKIRANFYKKYWGYEENCGVRSCFLIYWNCDNQRRDLMNCKPNVISILTCDSINQHSSNIDNANHTKSTMSTTRSISTLIMRQSTIIYHLTEAIELRFIL